LIARLIRRSGRKAPAAVPADVIAFQNDLDALVGEPVPWFLRRWPALAGALILSLVVLAALMRVDVVVIAPGRLMADVPPVVLQPIGSAVLRELRVRAGETVAEGQVLAVLDSTFTTADRQTLEAQRRALVAQRNRLAAELSGDVPDLAPGDAEARLQGELLAQRRSFIAARRAALDAELQALEGAAQAERRAGAGLDEQLAVAREVEAMRAQLAEDQIGSRLNLLVARAARLAVEQDQRQHVARLDELSHRATAQRAELDAFVRDWERQLLEELARVGPELARIEEQLAKAARLDALTLLRAPRAGVVLDVARRSPGSLVREGEAVVTLVPSDVPLIAEIALRSADIGRLRAGDGAVLKIDSFPWRRYGTLSGVLRAISRESYPSDDEATGGTALHRGQIAIGTDASLSPGATLIPGMTLSAETKVGTRSVLEFFLEPLLRGLQESLREP